MKGTFRNPSTPRWLVELWARLDGEPMPRVWFKRIPKQK
jgi:hypothetical protein